MKVTIGIPCYKQAQYLHEAIESALNQSYRNIEIIVVNDGSPDNAKEVAEKYPVKLINQVNKGLPSARNTAIMSMAGDIFFPLDSDDKILPQCIKTIVDKFKETDSDIVAPSLQEFGNSNVSIILKENPTIEDFKKGNHIGYFSAIKKEALLEVGGYNPKMVYGWEDWDLWFDLLKRGKKLVTIPIPLVLYRTKAESMYQNSLKYKDFLETQLRLNHPEIYE